jgi:hypothetical protein
MTDWDRVLDLARAQETAAAGRRWDDLLEIQATLHALLQSAGPPPAEARHALEEAYAASKAAEQVLFGALAERKGLLERLRDGRRALGAYAGSPARAALDAQA